MESVNLEGQTPGRLFLLIFIPVALLIMGGAWYVAHERIQSELALIQNDEVGKVVMGVMRLDDELHEPLAHLRTLATKPALVRAISGETGGKEALETEFARLLSFHGGYDKARWIDENGRERVRVNLREGQVQPVSAEALQSVMDQNYFRDAMKLKPGQIYVSPLDLNVELGKVDTPHKPMLRLATPVSDPQGRPRGVLLLNVAARGLLDAFTKSLIDARDHISLINADGYWLRSPDSEDEWGFMLGKTGNSLKARHPDAWQAINAIPAGQVHLTDGLWTWSTVYPLKQESGSATPAIPSWLVVAHLGPQRLALVQQEAWPVVLNVAVAVLAVFAFLSAWLARALIGRTRAVADAVLAHAEAETAKRTCEVLERFHLVVEANANGLLVVNQRGRIVLANPALERMFGHPPGTLIGKPMEILLPEALRHGHSAMRDGYLATPTARPMGVGRELTGQRLDGSLFPVEISLSPFTENGQQFVDAVVVDITERKQAEALLRRREAHLELLVATHPEGLLVVDPEGRIEIANPAAEELFGYGRGELLGRPVDCLAPESPGASGANPGLLAAHLLDPAGAHATTLAGRKKDGSPVAMAATLARFSDEGRTFVQITLRPAER